MEIGYTDNSEASRSGACRLEQAIQDTDSRRESGYSGIVELDGQYQQGFNQRKNTYIEDNEKDQIDRIQRNEDSK